MTSSNATTSRDRAVGALVGLAVGDAVGTTLEFQPPGSFTPIDDMVGGGPFGLEAGQWTDDTSMAMCLAESILDVGDLDPADQLRRYVAWWRDGYWSSNGRCFDIGGTTAGALSRFEDTGAVTDHDVDQERAANGSLMRLAPGADPLAQRHRRGGRACGRVEPHDASGVAPGRRVPPARGDDRRADPGPLDRRGRWTRASGSTARSTPGSTPSPEARGARSNHRRSAAPATSSTRSKPRCGRSPEQTTSATRCCARRTSVTTPTPPRPSPASSPVPAGAGRGSRRTWRRRITHGDRIAAIAGRLFDLGAGVEPSHPWPHDEIVHGYWVEPGRILAGEYPGTPDSVERARAKVDLLVDHGIRTFVDLTTPHDAMAPYEHLVADAADRRRLDLRRIPHPIPDMGTLPVDDYDEIVATDPGRVGPRRRVRALLGWHRTHRHRRRLPARRRRPERRRCAGPPRRAPVGHPQAADGGTADPRADRGHPPARPDHLTAWRGGRTVEVVTRRRVGARGTRRSHRRVSRRRPGPRRATRGTRRC